MKKAILMLLASFFTLFASAQIKVQGQSSSVKITSVSSSMGVLSFSDKYGYILSLVSSNKYDKAGNYILGETKESAIQTLKDLLELCGTIGDDILTVEVQPGRTCVISKSINAGWLSLKFDRHAGRCRLRDSDIAELIDAIEQFER